MDYKMMAFGLSNMSHRLLHIITLQQFCYVTETIKTNLRCSLFQINFECSLLCSSYVMRMFFSIIFLFNMNKHITISFNLYQNKNETITEYNDFRRFSSQKNNHQLTSNTRVRNFLVLYLLRL